jgi:hypothetical protein
MLQDLNGAQADDFTNAPCFQDDEGMFDDQAPNNESFLISAMEATSVIIAFPEVLVPRSYLH